MNKKLQVFVSSTYTDLIEERQSAVQAILDAGHIPAGMELFKAGKSQMKTIQKWIDESDVYMLILGGRYGSIEEDSGLSYTELEYKYALSKNMPVFAIVLDESYLFTKAASIGKDAIFEKDNSNKYDDFKEFVKKQIVHFISNKDQISGKIHSQLNDLLTDADYSLGGWIRYTDNQTKIISLLSKLEKKSEMVAILRKKIFTFPSRILHSEYDFQIDGLNLFIFCYKLYSDYIYFIVDKNGINTIKNNFLYRDISPYFLSFGLIEHDKQASCYKLTNYATELYKYIQSNETLNHKLIEELNAHYEDIIINSFYACTKYDYFQ